MNIRRKELLKSFIMISLVCGILIFSIVSLDTEHVSICNDNHCSLCAAIDFSQKLVMTMMVTMTALGSIIFLISYFLAERYEGTTEKVCLLNTLVYQKIQMNE